jgi:hypothetical protein
MTFVKGESGNPWGRPLGSRNRKTLIIEGLLEGEAETLTRKAVDLALNGNTGALRLCLDRLLPRARHRPVPFELPAVETAADLGAASIAVLRGIATGQIAPAEARDIMRVIESAARYLAIAELHQRLAQPNRSARMPPSQGDGQAENTSAEQAIQPEEPIRRPPADERPAQPQPSPSAGGAGNTSAEQGTRPGEPIRRPSAKVHSIDEARNTSEEQGQVTSRSGSGYEERRMGAEIQGNNKPEAWSADATHAPSPDPGALGIGVGRPDIPAYRAAG